MFVWNSLSLYGVNVIFLSCHLPSSRLGSSTFCVSGPAIWCRHISSSHSFRHLSHFCVYLCLSIRILVCFDLSAIQFWFHEQWVIISHQRYSFTHALFLFLSINTNKCRFQVNFERIWRTVRYERYTLIVETCTRTNNKLNCILDEELNWRAE